MPWAPAKSLDGSLVVGLLKLGRAERPGIPDGDEVVVATGRELSTIRSPLKSTDFGSVGNEISDLVLGDSDVMVHDETATSTSGKKMLVPAHNTDAGVVAVHAA